MSDLNPHIGVIGLGKLGICFALNLDHVGFQVTGLDLNPDYVAQINQRTLQSFEPQVENLLASAKQLHATTDLGELLATSADLIFLVVATPSLPDGSYNHQQVDNVVAALRAQGRSNRPRHLVVMCTTMPGYCDSIAEELATLNYTLSYNPEFIAQGTVVRDQQFPDQVLIGEASEAVGDMIVAVYAQLCQSSPTYCRMSRISAEIAKIATNCFLTTKISFANSIGDLATRVGAEPDKILAAIGSDDRIGARYLKYGFGYGGPCFPRDNRALGLYGSQQGYPMLISNATDQVNQNHLQFQVAAFLATHPEDQALVFDTVTYKEGTTILEESQQLALAVEVAKAGRQVSIIEHPAVIHELKAAYGDLFTYLIRG